MKIAGLDPGTGESGFVVIETEPFAILLHTIELNHKLISEVRPEMTRCDAFGCEWMEEQGIRLNDDTTETVLWAGAMIWEWGWWDRVELVRPRAIKKHLYGANTGNDSRKRQSLIERFGDPGTKRQPGPLYGIKGHEWSALAVAVVVAERHLGRRLSCGEVPAATCG